MKLLNKSIKSELSRDTKPLKKNFDTEQKQRTSNLRLGDDIKS